MPAHLPVWTQLAALRGQVSQWRAENDRLLPFTVPDWLYRMWS